MQFRGDIPTPALLLDLDTFEDNIRKMASHLKARNKAFRPHGKTHKCPDIARRLIDAGAVGICAARVSEAEVFADHGIGGLLVTTAVVGRDKIARAIALARRAPDTMFVVDDAQNARELNDAADGGAPIKVLIDLYFGRTGIEPGEPAVTLARLIDGLPNLSLEACNPTTVRPPTRRHSPRAKRAPTATWPGLLKRSTRSKLKESPARLSPAVRPGRIVWTRTIPA
jgi:D-serine deaminase-like pyridoxal phosphate-dependent protein